MKTLLLTLTYLVGIGELLLAIYFWVTNSKNEIRRVMALLAFSTGMWVITSAMIAYRPQFQESTLLINSLIYTFGILLLTTLLHLVIIFPKPLWRLDMLHKALLYVPAVMLSIIALSTRLIELNYISDTNNVGEVIAGPLLPFYNITLIAIFCIALFVLFLQIRKGDGINRKNAKYLFWSVIIGGLPAVYIDLVLPIVAPSNVPNFLFGVLGSSFWFATTTYVILKK